jgi:hypothetical protein
MFTAKLAEPGIGVEISQYQDEILLYFTTFAAFVVPVSSFLSVFAFFRLFSS